ncbi:MAG: hypothetical protein PHC83_06635 [Bacteroidales bacterium]|nr:hypothetical protein [Bacteroidales bacterium]MDD4210460.1 hypothetical protein [Bacteroidales bacterium]
MKMNNQLLKNLLWSVLCILCSWVSNAQPYHSFVEEDKIVKSSIIAKIYNYY